MGRFALSAWSSFGGSLRRSRNLLLRSQFYLQLLSLCSSVDSVFFSVCACAVLLFVVVYCKLFGCTLTIVGAHYRGIDAIEEGGKEREREREREKKKNSQVVV